MTVRPILAVIPCRGGSQGLPGKNIRDLVGLPLVAHSIRLAKLCPEIARCIVSTDSKEIANVAREHGGDVPFLRPRELAQDDTPMWPVLQHALQEMERQDKLRYEGLLLLDPTSPGRLPEDLVEAIRLLDEDAGSVGVVAASEPHFNPRWTCIEQKADGYISQIFADGVTYTRRQDVPSAYRINGALYLWRRDYVASAPALDLYGQPHRMVAIPEERAIHIDSIHDFNLAEILIRQKAVQFPWLPLEDK
jgi:CMP-N,N'-diacetyllegionaminic acid synthase